MGKNIEFDESYKYSILKMRKNLNYIEKRAVPRADVTAINRVARDAVPAMVTHIYKTMRANSVPVKRFHVQKRIREGRKATIAMAAGNRFAIIKGWNQPIPAIRLAQNRAGELPSAIKQEMGIKQDNTLAMIRRKKARRMRTKKSTLGGVRVGGKIIPQGFLNFISKRMPRPIIHVMARNQKKTWLPGFSGWNNPTNKGRAPYRVIKYDTGVAFKDFERIVDGVAKAKYDIEFNKAFERVLARAVTGT